MCGLADCAAYPEDVILLTHKDPPSNSSDTQNGEHKQFIQ